MSLSNYAELKMLDHLLGKGTRNFTSPPTLAVAMCSAVSGSEPVTVTEFANANAYVRREVTFAAASSGNAKNSTLVSFPTATGNQGTCTHIAVFDDAGYGAGNLLVYGALTASKTIDTGDTFEIKINNLTVNLD